MSVPKKMGAKTMGEAAEASGRRWLAWMAAQKPSRRCLWPGKIQPMRCAKWLARGIGNG